MSQNRSKLFMECMDFLYAWVEKGVITNGIRKGAPEELEAFITAKLSQAELERASQNMRAQTANIAIPEAQPEIIVSDVYKIVSGKQEM